MKRPSGILVLLSAVFVVSIVAEKQRYYVTPPPNRHYRTLMSIDGGGLRLHMTNQILKELEAQIKDYYLRHPELLPQATKDVKSADDLEVQLADHFTFISGVSGGSWVSLYYSSKGGKETVADLFKRRNIIEKYGHLYPGAAAGLDVFFEVFGCQIYPPPILGFRLPKFRWTLTHFPIAIPGFNSPLYETEGLERTLQIFYGDTRLSDLHTTSMVHAYDLNHRTPVLFTFNNMEKEPRASAAVVHSSRAFTLKGMGDESLLSSVRDEGFFDISFEDFYIRDIARASSAAPGIHIAKEVFSTAKKNQKSYLCIDGTIAVPDPAIHSLNFMMRNASIHEFNNIAGVSLGTGITIGENSESVGSGAGWLLSGDLMNIIYTGGVTASQANLFHFIYRLMNASEGQFRRFQVVAEHGSGFEAALNSFAYPKHLPVYKELGEDAVVYFREDLKHFVEQYIVATNEEKAPESEQMRFKSVFRV